MLTSTACTTAPTEPVSRAAPRPATLAPRPSPPEVRAAPLPDGVLATFRHDVSAFTEGLVLDHDVLYESTGLYGESRLRKIELSTGRVLVQVRLGDAFFGEGLALLGGELFQLTYREGRCFVYDAATLERRRELLYAGEGWGLATDGHDLVMSDGTPTLTFRDPRTFQELRHVTVTGPRGPVSYVNELEWVDGFVLANVWGTNDIVRIDPSTGRVVQTVDLAWLPEPRRGATEDDVLNGIAFDPSGDGRLLVTGKRWSTVFAIPRPWR